MRFLFTRKTLLPTWLIVFGTMTVFGDAISGSMRALLLFVGVVGPGIVYALRREPPQTVAEVLHDAEKANRSLNDSAMWRPKS